MSIVPNIENATLLSVAEAVNFLSADERKHNDCWWMRSSGCDPISAAYVSDSGSVHFLGARVDDFFSVRPALRINIKNSNFKIGDIFIFGKKMFKIISDNLAFCTDDIGKFCFRKNFDAEDANNYEKSDAKKIVDQWFARATNYQEMLERQMQKDQYDEEK